MHKTLAYPPIVPLRPVQSSFTVVLVTLLAALLARQVFAIWEGYDGSMTYDELQAFGDAYWPMNLLVFGPSFGIGFACQAILSWQLGRGRGRVTTWVGAGLLLTGGMLFALVATAHSLPYDWAANHGILDETTGRAVVAAFDGPGTAALVPYIIATQAVIAAGALVTAIGARLSGTLPTWALVAVVILVLAFVFVPEVPGSPIVIALSLAQAAMWGAIGWFGWRAAQDSGAGPLRAGE